MSIEVSHGEEAAQETVRRVLENRGTIVPYGIADATSDRVTPETQAMVAAMHKKRGFDSASWFCQSKLI